MENLNTQIFTTASKWVCPAGITSVKIDFIFGGNTLLNLQNISSSWDFNLLLDQNNKPYGVGSNNTGNLGDNTTITRSFPVSVVGNHSFAEIWGGSSGSSARKTDGSVWCWGSNADGQLGDNTTYTKYSPVLVVGEHSFVEISLKDYFVLARKADGSVWGWGNGGAGNLGNNAVDAQSSPVLAVGNHNFVEISAGVAFSLARKADGSVWSWGDNTLGNLGDNTVTSKSSPVLVVGSHSFVEISANKTNISGSVVSLARKADGSVWAWGYNEYGMLGDNTIVYKSSPVLVVGNHSFVEISAGGEHSLARKADGSVWAWGVNNGRLGDNTDTYRSSPVLAVGNHSFSEISGGYNFSLAKKSDGTAWGWGDNTYGQLSNIYLTTKSSPVLCAFITSGDIIENNPMSRTFIYPVVPNTTYDIVFSDSMAIFDNKIRGIGNLMLSWLE